MTLFERFQYFTDADLVRAIGIREHQIVKHESEIKVLKKIQRQRLAHTQPAQMDTQASAAR